MKKSDKIENMLAIKLDLNYSLIVKRFDYQTNWMVMVKKCDLILKGLTIC